MQPRERLEYSSIETRPPLKLPDGVRMVIWPVIALEDWDISRAMARMVISPPQGQPMLPDHPNWSWHEYGMRVGFWRLKKMLDRLGLVATVPINGKTCETYPQVVQACIDNGWELNAHGYEQMPMHKVEDQRGAIFKALDTIEAFSGKRPRGWFGPGLTQTFDTLDYLSEAGVEYIGDWVLDDEPVTLKTAHKPVVAMPYNFEIHDIVLWTSQHHPSDMMYMRGMDQFNCLYDEAAERPKFMAIGMHGFLSGVPHRIGHVERLFKEILSREDVACWTGGQILDWYRSQNPKRVKAGMTKTSDIAIIGGGICGLAIALNLHRLGIPCTVYERAPHIKELGVGITLLPHGMREFTALGIGDELLKAGIENVESCFFNRFGQLIYKEPRGKLAGYQYPEVGIHRGRLHTILFDAARKQLGPDRILTDRDCVGFTQDEDGVTLSFKETSTGRTLEPSRAAVAIAGDGINSTIRKTFYPNEQVAFVGINTWRGVTRRKPILTGRSYMRVGSILTGKIVIYPIVDNVDGEGNQLINWMAEIKTGNVAKNDWNKSGNLDDFFHIYKDWRFDWLDVAEMIRNADQILEYPMVDKDPVKQWTFGRVTFAGDAAHPMYPRGSNGSAQAAIDARTLADCLKAHADPRDALKAYEAARLEPTAKVVRTNREFPPDFINIKVEELVGDKPFKNLDDYITQDELRALSDNYKKIAGFALSDVSRASGRSRS